MWKILLVDDNPNDRLLMIRLIAKELPRAQCVEATTASKFSEALEHFDFDVVVTDYDLPWGNGLEVLRQVKARFPFVPVLMVTGTGTEEVAVQALKEGLSDYLIKKHMRRLPAAILEALEKAKMKEKLDDTLKELKASEHRYRRLVECARDFIFTLDLEGRYTFVNQQPLEALGISSKDFLGKRVFEVHEQRGTSCYEEVFQRVLQTKQAVTFEHPFVHRELMFWHQDTLYPILDENGNVEAIGGICTDITERVHAEEKNRLLYNALQQAAEGIAVATADGTIIYANPALSRLTGYKVSELEGRSLRLFESSQQDASFYRKLWSSVLAGNAWRGDLKTRTKEGRDRLFEVMFTPIRDAFGGVGHVVSVNRDVTDERALESQVVQTQKMQALGTLAGGIAHDFNNILGAIMGYAELARMHAEDPDKVRHSMLRVVESGRRARDLVQQILTFTRPTPSHERKPVQVRYLVREAVKMLRATLPATIEIREQFPSHLPTVLADPTHIHQVIMNLCTNAYHAMKDNGGVLELQLEAAQLGEHSTGKPLELGSGNYVLLSVRDTGHGMSPEVMERIFEPYFTTKEVGEGTGLGLSVVHGIVRALGGAVAVESRPGQGSVFRVYLPALAEDQSVGGLEEIPGELPRGSGRILVVDDEEMLVQMTRQILEKLGYTVKCFSDPEKALSYLLEHGSSTDLLITDLTMPKLTGRQLAEAAWQIRPDLPVVLTSGYEESFMEQKAPSQGFTVFLKKPFSLMNLSTALRKALALKASSTNQDTSS